jgi:nucleoside-triphosphatase
MVDFLQARGKPCRGFYTDEVLDPRTKTRIGFDVVTVPDGKRGVLSRKAGFGLQPTTTKHKTGKYFVDVASFEAIALPSLVKTMTATTSPSSPVPKKRKLNDRMNTKNSNRNSGNDSDKNGCNHEDDCILVLDEIGRMELHSTAFSDLVRDLLGCDSPTATNRLVGAITAPIYGHRVPFCDEVASRSGVEVHKLTKNTRDGVVQELLQSIEDRGWVERKVQEL